MLTPQAALFAKMCKMASDDRITSSPAKLLVVRQSVDVTVAWAKHAISQFLQPKLDTTGQFSASPLFEISGIGLP